MLARPATRASLQPGATAAPQQRPGRAVIAAAAPQPHATGEPSPTAAAAAASGALAAAAAERATRRAALAAVVAGIAAVGASPATADENAPREGAVRHTDAEWRQLLSPKAYGVLRQAKTEPPLTSPLNKEKRAGTFCCGGCGQELYSSAMKYDSGTGWPSFFDALPGAVALEEDRSIPFMPRVEVRCSRCLGHLGHVFEDGPPPTGLRYCMNGAAMTFQPQEA